MNAQSIPMRVLLNWRLAVGASLLVALGVMLGRAEPAHAGPSTYTVNSTNDTAGVCGATCTLRQAIQAVNAGPGGDTIAFNLHPGATISAHSALPPLLVQVTIDGTTMPDYVGSPIVAIEGETAGPAVNGLVLNGAGSVLKGIVIHSFSGHGLVLNGGQTEVTNCRIGTNIAGTEAMPNAVGLTGSFTQATPYNGSGLLITSAENVIGGPEPGQGNLISGNAAIGVTIYGASASENTLTKNFIGTDASGTADLGNQQDGVLIEAPSNTLTDNVISANGASQQGPAYLPAGVTLYSFFSNDTHDNVLRGNFIGTNATGTAALGNYSDGVLAAGSNDVIGGTEPGRGNVISGNAGGGVNIIGGSAQVLGNRIGTDVTGSLALGNHWVGVEVFSRVASSIGGAGAAANVISGNVGWGVDLFNNNGPPSSVLGNLVGTDASGHSAVGNGDGGINVNGPSLIGGAGAGEGNLISGNGGPGVQVGGAGTVLLGNRIGTDVGGNSALGNASHGVALVSSGSVSIGGAAAGAGNLISGNLGSGVSVTSDSGTGSTISGNTIGTDVTGAAALGNAGDGVTIKDAGPTVGAAGAGNLISGNLGSGVSISGGSNSQVLGNKIGTNAAGLTAIGNGSHGVAVATPGITIGGSLLSSRNLISGNTGDGVFLDSSNDQVLGNFIGTDVTGAAALGNGGDGVAFGSSSPNGEVGGSNAGAGNVISGNAGSGISIAPQSSSGAVVMGNKIGTNANGSAALGNGGNGVSSKSGNTTIGGSIGGARNLISGNAGDGVFLFLYQGSHVEGNFIGTDVNGSAAIPNSIGVEIGPGFNNTIGGTGGAGNLISGNTNEGVLVNGQFATPSATAGNVVLGNRIGTDVTGTVALGNSVGVNLNDAQNSIVGGTDPGTGNLISGNRSNGLQVTSCSCHYGLQGTNNKLLGNLIGTDVTGTVGLGNQGHGVFMQALSATVGGTASGAGNVISDNGGDGVSIAAVGALPGNNSVLGNWIGTDGAGTAVLGNGGDGVILYSDNNTIGGSAAGAANVVANNLARGINVFSGQANLLSRNSIHDNGDIGIDLGSDLVTPNDPLDVDGGANNSQNYPTLAQVGSEGPTTEVDGLLNSSPNSTYTIEFFTNDACDGSGFGEGRTFLGSGTVTTDQNGHADYTKYFSASLNSPTGVTATATDQATGDTSEFSPCEEVTRTSADLRVTKTASPTRVMVGNPVTFKIRVFNNGPFTSHNVSFVDTLPAGFTVQAASTTQGSCIKAQTVRCDLNDLSLDKTVIVTIQVRPTSVGTYRNTASAFGDENDSPTTNNFGGATVAVRPDANGCTMVGTSGPDTLNGTAGDDVICGLGGNDTINGNAGDDVLYGGDGADTMNGGAGNDVLLGGNGNDKMVGNAGSDSVNGDAGADTINIKDGVSGNDSADGGAGSDTCTKDSGDTVTNCP
jgi:uncharacterized repeat protein (TIGR01451 family)/CSLREA domain-containing protein